MKKFSLCILVAGAMLGVQGCSLFKKQVTTPDEVSLRTALRDIGCGLRDLQEAQGPVKTGNLVSSMEVNLKLGATSSAKDTLTVDFTGSSRFGASGGTESSVGGTRENTVKIAFTHPLFAGENTALLKASDARLAEIVRLIATSEAGSVFRKFAVDVNGQRVNLIDKQPGQADPNPCVPKTP